MYRNTAQFSGSNIGTLQAPRNEKPKAENDISCIIAEKRQQIDEEIAQFRAFKEKEFQDFEKDLLRQKQKRKREAAKSRNGISPTRQGKAPTALSLLGVLNQSDAQANVIEKKSRKPAVSNTARRTPVAPPTLSIEKLNITGETTPPLAGNGSPPSSSSCLKRQFSRSPPSQSLSHTPPRARTKAEVLQLTPPTPTIDRSSETFAGIFSPAYLPLLESRPNGNVEKRLTRSESFSLTQTSSVSASPLSRNHRAQTAPLLPSNSLPSALRTPSGTAMRKHKRVTFKLADSAIVEPSSSYEEGPSPMREDELDFDEKIDDAITNGDGEHDSNNEDASGFEKRTIRSPSITPREPKGPRNSRSVALPISESAHPENGIGFFELDEELASPGHQSHDAKFIDDDEQDAEISRKFRNGEGEDGFDDDDFDMRTRPTYEYSGSVPIDIMRPSGSWVGSFGH